MAMSDDEEDGERFIHIYIYVCVCVRVCVYRERERAHRDERRRGEDCEIYRDILRERERGRGRRGCADGDERRRGRW